MMADPFIAAFFGRFQGIRSWSDLDAVWEAIGRNAADGWYAYTLNEGPPATPSKANAIRAFVAALDAGLRSDHPTCGFVYVDDVEAPGFVKVFEAKKFSGCGMGQGPALPSWILCKLPPSDLIAATTPKSWWKRVLHPFG